ncbi:MAG: leucine-rich repeat domain-containing protein [Algibacter sp.]|uniref:leucine-rich repeat domain-containing protein n=1 Tax=Algibacter sp. TaxID=1872428 RepID=UPI003299BE2C
MKKTLLLFITFLTVGFVNAQDFTVGDISYTITASVVGGDATDEVAVQGSTLAALDIPSTVENGGVTYTVTSVETLAFQNNSTITSLTLPSTLKTIGSNAFNNCSSLALDPLDLTHVTSVGSYAFYQSSLITSVIVPDGITFADGVLRNTGLTSFTIPASWTTLPNQMLRDCTSITSINIPSTVTSLSAANFRGCTNLTEIQVNSSTPIAVPNANAIATINAGAILYVPDATAESAYEADAAWLAVFDASRIVTGTLSTKNLEQELGFSIYPNPTNGVVSIQSQQLNNAQVSVYDLNGRALLSKPLNGTSSEINISNMASGVYLLKVQVENSEFVKRIIKQ